MSPDAGSSDADESDRSDGLPDHPECPHCDGTDTRLESGFGSTLATAQYYCTTCRSMFEYVKWER